MECAKELGVYIFYDEKQDIFLDKDGNQIDVKNKCIFPRTGDLQAKSLIDAIIKHGGNSIVTKDDYDKTLNWPYYLKTIRNNIILSGSQIVENPQLIIDVFGQDKVFFKTKFKNFSQIIEVSEFLNQDSAFLMALKEHSDDDFIISDAVSIEEDKYGVLEYRAFILNGEILNISRISDFLLETIPREILDKLKESIANLKENDFASSYVIDIFVYKDKTGRRIVDVLECNPIIASGTYLYNSIFEQQQDIIHNCPSASIPKEKIKYGESKYYSFDTAERRTPSIYYNLPGGFASDLTSFTFFGRKSTNDTYFHFSSGNINLLGIGSLISDGLLSDSVLLSDSDSIDDDISAIIKK